MGTVFEDIAKALTVAEVEHHMDHLAHEMVEYGKEIAPVFADRPPHRSEPEDGEPGSYRDSIHSINRGLSRRRIQSDDPKAAWIEYGTSHMPEYGVFGKMSEHFGGDGEVVSDEGVQHAQHRLRHALESLAELRTSGDARAIADAEAHIVELRRARSAAFRAARGPRRRTRGGRKHR